MGHTIKLAAIGAVAFMVLDGVWLGLLMKNVYRHRGPMKKSRDTPAYYPIRAVAKPDRRGD